MKENGTPTTLGPTREPDPTCQGTTNKDDIDSKKERKVTVAATHSVFRVGKLAAILSEVSH